MAELELTQVTAGTYHSTAEAFIAILAHLERGQAVVYARGQLARSLHDTDHSDLHSIARIALADANRGQLCLTQRRVAQGNGFGVGGAFEYRATRR